MTLERTARLAAGEVAYGDELGVRYVYDSHVPHHADVQVGDLAVLRDDKVVLGAGRIDNIDTGTGLKVRQRCPTCRSTGYKFRTRAVIPFRCSDCGTEFAETDKTDVSAVKTYAADYSRTWSPANTLLPVTAITTARRQSAEGPRTPGLMRGSSKLSSAVARLERDRLWPGAVAQALRHWSRIAHRPRRALSGGCGCELCHPFYDTEARAVLELALHGLPPQAARELRRLVSPLDDLYLARTWPDPLSSPDDGWWARRCWG